MKPRPSTKRWIPWARDIAIVLVIVLLFQWWQTRTLVSGLAPELSGELLDGTKVTLSDHRGQPVLVHFWATWCPVCRTEDDNIHNLAEDYRVLTIATNSGDALEIGNYLAENQLEFPVMLDESGQLGREWGISGVPSSFIVNADGEIESVAVGYTTEIGLRVRLWLAGR